MSLRKIIYILFVFLWAIAVKAQRQETPLLQGRVLNSEGEAVVGAVVSCITLPDSTIVSNSVVKADGSFQIITTENSHENILLVISATVFATYCYSTSFN